MLVTAGERISMSLLSIALNSLGCRAVSFTGSQVGIITDTRHTDARILEVRPQRLVRELERGAVVVVGGFQGVSTEKEVTTLGRGGSDTTAVALAAALGAERCEILTDVDGVHTADPRVVADAEKVDELAYCDMAELARYGATVLKEEAVRLAEREGIALHVGDAARAAPGTIVLERPLISERPVVAISLLESASLLCTGGGDEGLERLARHGDALRFVAASDGMVSAAVESDGLPGSLPASLVCAVGPGAGGGATLTSFANVSSETASPLLAVASTTRSTVAAVERERGHGFLRRLHEELFRDGSG
jgi:aspartokinase